MIYQWQHYFAVREYAARFHYKIGLFSFLTICVVIISGFPLVFDLNQKGIFYPVVDMVHIVSSFAFLIWLSGHLVLVARVTLARFIGFVPSANRQVLVALKLVSAEYSESGADRVVDSYGLSLRQEKT